ncbi:HAD-like domain-containing protein [Russula vinacea]|nr:HAD-like domain-containing protein [Russula vinacea]
MQPAISITAPTPTDLKPTVHGRKFRTTTFFADAALFDMDGTLTDSIAAVEAAWSKVAREIGADPAFMGAAVEEFERSILFYADACALRRASRSSSFSLLSDSDSNFESTASNSSVEWEPELELDAAEVDRAVRILPGVQSLLESIPEGRYAVATSGAKTYAHGCLGRVGIVPPKVTITADDPRLRAGKPAPDPFLLAAECLGYRASRCVAGVAAGAIVIAVCTSHSRKQIKDCGAHFIVENLEDTDEGTRLMFTVEH